MMRNPFKTPMPDAMGAYNPTPETVGDSLMQTTHNNLVYLDDAYYPENVAITQAPYLDTVPTAVHPDYDETPFPGGIRRELVYTPGPTPDPYQFTNPAAGSVDLAQARDTGGVPGTAQLNVFHGPVDGNSMDVWQVGARTQLITLPPGYNGPVGKDSPDYANAVANAAYQQMFADYSVSAATDAQIAAI